MVKATTITINSLLARPKLDCDVGYDMAVKGASVVVNGLYILLGPWYLHLHLHPPSRVRISRILSVKRGRLETYILKPRLR